MLELDVVKMPLAMVCLQMLIDQFLCTLSEYTESYTLMPVSMMATVMVKGQ